MKKGDVGMANRFLKSTETRDDDEVDDDVENHN